MNYAYKPVFDAKLQKVVDSGLNVFTNSLEEFDKTINMPLTDVTWTRDMTIRDIPIETAFTSFTRNAYGAIGTNSAQGKPFINAHANAIPNISIDREKVSAKVRNLGMIVGYDILEMKRSQRDNSGQDVLTERLNAFNEMYNMWTDEMVYEGDAGFNVEGLINSSQVVANTVPIGAGGTTPWNTKTPDEILNDIDELLCNVYEETVNRFPPDTLLIPSQQFCYINSTRVGSSSDNTILNFVMKNNISKAKGINLEIKDSKWLKGAGVGGTDRMIAYTNANRFIRFPLARPQTIVPAGWNQRVYEQPYDWAYGEVEFVYPETIEYADGI